jgi:ubiquinol-cytochrome c reductase cytochrome c1 subunit
MVRLLGILIGFGFVLVAASRWSRHLGLFQTEHHETRSTLPRASAQHLLLDRRPFGVRPAAAAARLPGLSARSARLPRHQLCRFRNLAELGYNEAEIRKVASEFPGAGHQSGDRRARDAARASPPIASRTPIRTTSRPAPPTTMRRRRTLSLIVKARHGGRSISRRSSPAIATRRPIATITASASRGEPPGQGLYFNPYFPNLNLAMQPP